MCRQYNEQAHCKTMEVSEDVLNVFSDLGSSLADQIMHQECIALKLFHKPLYLNWNANIYWRNHGLIKSTPRGLQDYFVRPNIRPIQDVF